MARKDTPGRVTIVVRLPAKLVKQIDRRAEAERVERGSKWSRNDRIVKILTDHEERSTT